MLDCFHWRWIINHEVSFYRTVTVSCYPGLVEVSSSASIANLLDTPVRISSYSAPCLSSTDLSVFAQQAMATGKECLYCCSFSVRNCLLYIYTCFLFYVRLFFADVYYRLEAAQSSPETLTQENIIQNLDPAEAARLSKVRNIGIAVSTETSSFSI